MLQSKALALCPGPAAGKVRLQLSWQKPFNLRGGDGLPRQAALAAVVSFASLGRSCSMATRSGPSIDSVCHLQQAGRDAGAFLLVVSITGASVLSGTFCLQLAPRWCALATA